MAAQIGGEQIGGEQIGGEQIGGEQLWYLYGVVPIGQQLPAGGFVALETVPFADLVAVVEHVPASEFSAETIAQNLQCVDWVAPLARKHTAVLDAVLRHGPVVPARLCTLFSSAHALRDSLEYNQRRLQQALSWLRGREEWGCKIFSSGEKLRCALASSDREARAIEAAAATASPGHAHVLRKKRDARLLEVAGARIDEVVDEVLDALASLSVDTCLRTLLSEAVTGRPEAMVGNAALLVDLSDCPALRARAGELAQGLSAEGFTLELTGPWPPYSFCDDDDAPRDGADESPSEQAR